MGKNKTPLNYIEVLRKLQHSGLQHSREIRCTENYYDNLPTLKERVDKILDITNNSSKLAGNMLFFVMYDIESNKVRYNVVKYLQRMGCTRIQKSIFLADLNTEKYETIKRDLAEVQSLYDNHDSIIICPISTDLLKAMKIIGQSINIDVITQSKNTLFF
jgi:CRISPR-associated endonuclease Cas2